MPGESYDVLIRAGTVVDGTGARGRVADVGIRGDRIAAIGSLDEAHAGTVIDANGRVVAPGFIDVHSHDDAACLTGPLDFKLMQGVTTDVVGNCGAGIAPHNPEQRGNMILTNVLGEWPDESWRTFSEWMAIVERKRPAINVACLVPHGSVRYATLGMHRRAPDAIELDRMRADIDDGMAAGAVGLSTGLIYPPGSNAGTDEIVECAKVAARHGGIYVSHIRDESAHLFEAMREALTIGEQAELPVQISHHKAGSPAVWGRIPETVAMMDEYRSRGHDVTFDVYPYTAASTVLSAFLVEDPEFLDPQLVLLASVPERPDLEGKTLVEAAEILGVEPGAAARRVVSEWPGTTAVFFVMQEDDVRIVVTQPQCMIGSDGIPTAGKPHPRLYGTFPRVLQRYVREEGVLTIEEAVRKMTSLPADRFQLAGRGRLAEGAFADVVVFDPATIADVATYQQPRQYPAGIELVLVNGRVAATGGKQVETSSGRLLRRGQA